VLRYALTHRPGGLGHASEYFRRIPLRQMPRQEFYHGARQHDVAFTVATGDERLYADLPLTLGYIRPA
jgi:L-fucose mutarotase/ribose pyranase (RbsD/FucU family)